MTTTPDFLLLVPVELAGVSLRPGTGLYNSQDSQTIAAIQAKYGTNVALWPGTDPLVSAMAAVVKDKKKNHTNEAMTALMLSAALKSTLAGSVPGQAGTVLELVQPITLAAVQAAGAVTHLDFELSTGLPAGARLLGLPSIDGWTGFDDATHAVDQISMGTAAGGAQLGAAVAVDVTTGTGFPKAMAAGGYIGMALGGLPVWVRFSSAVNLSTLTAGAATVRMLYAVTAAG